MSLDKACGIYHGMRIELKEPNGKAPTKEQIARCAGLERKVTTSFLRMVQNKR